MCIVVRNFISNTQYADGAAALLREVPGKVTWSHRSAIFLDETVCEYVCVRVNREEFASAAIIKPSVRAPAKSLSARRPWQRVFRKSRLDTRVMNTAPDAETGPSEKNIGRTPRRRENYIPSDRRKRRFRALDFDATYFRANAPPMHPSANSALVVKITTLINPPMITSAMPF